MSRFEKEYEVWLQEDLASETNPRRRELLEKGLGHGTVEYLRSIWFPAVGNFNHLYAEWEVRDFHSGYRYLDLAYRPEAAKGGIEIHGFKSHARDLDVKRFKDLCNRHSLLSLDGWTFLTVPYLSIVEEPEQCRQILLAFIGKFLSTDVSADLNWLEAEALRFARRLPRPFAPLEVAEHLRVSDRHARRILQRLVELQLLEISSGVKRHRTYKMKRSG
ncbi:transcriptional regulator [Paenibacillaceae bacterium WGS1546]|uniref:transcriptional regulator n=1 Tax=Cohnella sp. WGS1546 TaxID=3366810 RepID=UPI00372D2B80